MKKPKAHTEIIPPKKLKGEWYDNTLMIGCCMMLTPMGDSVKFKLNGIKYTFERKWEG